MSTIWKNSCNISLFFVQNEVACNTYVILQFFCWNFRKKYCRRNRLNNVICDKINTRYQSSYNRLAFKRQKRRINFIPWLWSIIFFKSNVRCRLEINCLYNSNFNILFSTLNNVLDINISGTTKDNF